MGSVKYGAGTAWEQVTLAVIKHFELGSTPSLGLPILLIIHRSFQKGRLKVPFS